MQPVGILFVTGNFGREWGRCASREVLDGRMIEAREGSVNIDEKTSRYQHLAKVARNDESLHLQQILCLEKDLIDVLITIHNPLLLSWQMQHPIYEHSIRICNSRLHVFAIQTVNSENGA